MKYEPAFFAIDDGPMFAGVHNPNYDWNGWAVPLFTRDTMLTIADLNKLTVSHTNVDEIEDLLTQDIDGQTYYSFNGWCWAETDPKEHLDYLKRSFYHYVGTYEAQDERFETLLISYKQYFGDKYEMLLHILRDHMGADFYDYL